MEKTRQTNRWVVITKTRSKTKMLVTKSRSGPNMQKKITVSFSFKKTRSSGDECLVTEVPERINKCAIVTCLPRWIRTNPR